MEFSEFAGDDKDVRWYFFLLGQNTDSDRPEHLLLSRAMSSSSNRRKSSFLSLEPKTDSPRPFTPYSGLKLVELAQKFFPPGVVQSLSGDDNLGPWITSHPGIDKISFTGSSRTGKLVAASAAKTLKRVTLEL